MIIKLYWKACGRFAIEETGGYFVETTKEEVEAVLLPKMSKQEIIKFEAMKDVYKGKADTEFLKKDRFYFLVSEDGQEIKFESADLPAAEFLRGNENLKKIKDIEIKSIEEIEAIKPEPC